MAGGVNTRRAARRSVLYGSFEELATDLDRIASAQAAGALGTTGNWNAGQICEHVAILCECSMDGFPRSAPAIVRWMVILLFKKKALSGAPLKPGFKIPDSAGFLRPGEGTTVEAGVSRLRRVTDRVAAGEKFTQPSPIFGRLTHDEWVVLHLGHASMHLSFIEPGPAA